MAFNLNFNAQTSEMSQLQLEPGEMMFVLGANGAGKSSIISQFARQNTSNVRKISAHRQTWMNTDALDMTPSAKVRTESRIKSNDQELQSRYRDDYAAQRASMTIYELIDAENIRARAIAKAVDDENIEAAKDAAKEEAPIKVINELLLQSNIPIEISIHANETIMASKDGGPPFSAAQLSDGERNALLIAGNVLTAPPNTLLLIDEPERHLHRSIISPLLSQLFDHRSDCGFVISTHDHNLPLEVPNARTLLLRSCTFDGNNVQDWQADELAADVQVDDTLKGDLLGARRNILFVEGTESSLDKPLYSLMFPMVSVIPKGNCREVEQAVVGVRAGEGFHWLRAFGIADSDGFDATQIQAKRDVGVFTVPYYSVEAIYFHPQIIEWIADRQANVSGANANEMTSGAIAAGVAEISGHTERLCRKITKKSVRKLIIEQIPNDDQLLAGTDVTLQNNAATILAARQSELDTAVGAGDWQSILTKCPVRESGALGAISGTLGFQRVEDYQNAVRHLLSNEADALEFVRSLFDDLFSQLDS